MVATHRGAHRSTSSGGPRRAATLAPGVALAAVVAAAATAVGGVVPVVGAPVVAIVAGAALAATLHPGDALRPGLGFAGSRVLQGSIMVLGLGLSLHQVVAAGRSSLPVLVGTLAIALLAAWGAGRALALPRDLTLLVGVGTAICGASAIAATDSVIDADDADVSYAIATIFTFNVVAVLAYPSLGHLMGLSPHAFGLWAGTAINDTSSVVAAATTYGGSAATFAVVVKLTRTLAIIPICLALAAWRTRRAGAEVGTGAGRRGGVDWRRVLPLWILGFVAAVALDSAGVVPVGWHHGLSDLATWMITTALAAIGLSTRVDRIRAAGVRPLVLGAILWATVGAASLGLQAATGNL